MFYVYICKCVEINQQQKIQKKKTWKKKTTGAFSDQPSGKVKDDHMTMGGQKGQKGITLLRKVSIRGKGVLEIEKGI